MWPILLTAGALADAPTVKVWVDAPWVVAVQEEDHITLRQGDSAQGVRVQLVPDDSWRVGVTPIQGGRPVDACGVPMVQPVAAIAAVEIESQGPDLVVRMSGPPLASLARREDAPEDPALTWVRFRPRGTDWRLVLDGLGTITLPAQATRWSRAGLDVGEHAVLQTAARRYATRIDAGCWTLDTSPSIEEADPYPRTAWTWTPAP